ncbi:hypothetical protein JCGZ_03863 [Jatropha curcas]|uniref:Uncharacterized protein n=1 Tax=Jatropha curcas TaxID=180498 RepID=A0A067JMF2_JATCU|nr:hypothetical protein JCGZ_03863 [Jatropha curcas]
MQARLPEILEYTQAPPLVQLDPEHTTHVSAGLEIPRDLPAVRVCPILHRSALLLAARAGFGEREIAEASGPSV